MHVGNTQKICRPLGAHRGRHTHARILTHLDGLLVTPAINGEPHDVSTGNDVRSLRAAATSPGPGGESRVAQVPDRAVHAGATRGIDARDLASGRVQHRNADGACIPSRA